MKKLTITTILFCVAILNANETKNLHSNPGAENGSKGFGSYISKGKRRLGITSEVAKNGEKSIFLQCLANDTSVALMLFGSTGYIPRASLDVEKGQKYNVKFSIKSIKPMSNLTYYILFWKKGAHNPKGRVYRSTTISIDGKKTTKLEAGNDWREVEMNISIPAGVDKMDIAIQIRKGVAGDTIFVDDVNIIRKK